MNKVDTFVYAAIKEGRRDLLVGGAFGTMFIDPGEDLEYNKVLHMFSIEKNGIFDCSPIEGTSEQISFEYFKKYAMRELGASKMSELKFAFGRCNRYSK